MRAYVCRKTGEQVSDWTVLLCQQAQPGGSLSWNTSLGGGMQGVKVMSCLHFCCLYLLGMCQQYIRTYINDVGSSGSITDLLFRAANV